jgi:hypothetical protein
MESVQQFISTFEEKKDISFFIDLKLDKNSLKFEPPLREVKTIIENLYDSLIKCAEQFPHVENQLFSSAKEVKYLKIDLANVEPEFVASTKSILEENLEDSILELEQFLPSFQPYDSLMSGASYDQVTDFITNHKQDLTSQISVNFISYLDC